MPGDVELEILSSIHLWHKITRFKGLTVQIYCFWWEPGFQLCPRPPRPYTAGYTYQPCAQNPFEIHGCVWLNMQQHSLRKKENNNLQQMKPWCKRCCVRAESPGCMFTLWVTGRHHGQSMNKTSVSCQTSMTHILLTSTWAKAGSGETVRDAISYNFCCRS